MTKKANFGKIRNVPMDVECSEKIPKLSKIPSVQMSEENAKYSKNPGENSEKIQKKSKQNRKKITKYFWKREHIKATNVNLFKENLKCAQTLTYVPPFERGKKHNSNHIKII